jgi:hypothetical protein
MALAERALSTSPSALSRPADGASQANHSPLDRAAVMRRAHAIAGQARPHMPCYRAALAYGLRAAWSDAKARQEHCARFAGYVPRTLTPHQIAANRAATARVGRSMMPF